MAKFVFKFQTMLNIKEKLKDQKQIEFGKAIQALEEEKNKKTFLENSLQESVDGLKECVQTKVSPRLVFEYNAYIKKIKDDIINQDKNIIKAEEIVEEVRTQLQEALMEIKKYEKLKEKDLQNYIEEEKQKENSFIDEIVTYKYTNKDKD